LPADPLKIKIKRGTNFNGKAPVGFFAHFRSIRRDENLTGVQVQFVDTVDTDLLEGTDALRADRAEEQPHAIGLLASLAGHR
jgi:hypothetical protein